MSKEVKIAIFGKMRSGKDTIGKMLIEEFNFKRYAFGTGIGNIIDKYFPEATINGKPRKHYQHIGQQLRELDPDVWVKYLLKSVEKDGAKRVVVTDGRQVNEAERLRAEGYTIVKVVAPEEIRIKRILESGDVFIPEQLTHETERQVDLLQDCVVITNDRDLNYLRLQVTTLLSLLDPELGEQAVRGLVASD